MRCHEGVETKSLQRQEVAAPMLGDEAYANRFVESVPT